MEGTWQWAAYGKHPVAKDFFKVGQFSPLVKDFSHWVEEGYRLFAPQKKVSLNSWRFWTQAPKKEGLGCGVVRDCNDQLARPYPLLIMGVGTLHGWQEQWDLNPLACERTWTQMEYLYTKTFSSLKQLEEEVQKIPPPLHQWSGLQEARRNFLRGDPPSPSRGLQEVERQVGHLTQKAELFFPLDQELFRDPAVGIHYLHYFFRKEEKSIPQAVFMGGPLEKAHLSVFRRPLLPADFVQLWSVPSSGGS